MYAKLHILNENINHLCSLMELLLENINKLLNLKFIVGQKPLYFMNFRVAETVFYL